MSEAVRAALAAVVDGRSLERAEARAAMGAVMDGEATPAQLAALLVALRMRGETVDELTGFAEAMRERVVRVEAPAGTIDTCGTGGDHSGTFNISTAAAFVVASTGVPVAKHGNRAITSKSGLGRRARGAGRADRPRRGVGRRRAPGAGLRLPLRPVVPPGDAPRRADAPGDRRPNGLQPAGPDHEPRRGAPAGRRGG